MGHERESFAGPNEPHDRFVSRFLGDVSQALVYQPGHPQGRENRSHRSGRGEEFAVVDDNGLVCILTPREVELGKRFLPQILGQRPFDLKFQELARKVNQIKHRAVFGPGQ